MGTATPAITTSRYANVRHKHISTIGHYSLSLLHLTHVITEFETQTSTPQVRLDCRTGFAAPSTLAFNGSAIHHAAGSSNLNSLMSHPEQCAILCAVEGFPLRSHVLFLRLFSGCFRMAVQYSSRTSSSMGVGRGPYNPSAPFFLGPEIQY